MVATKQANGQRKGSKQGNTRKFKPGGMNGIGRSLRYNPRVPPIGMNPLFGASQIPDNPGYVDFNEPSPLGLPIPQKAPPKPPPIGIEGNNKPQRGPRRPNHTQNPKRMNPPRNQNGANGWAPQRIPPGGPMSQQLPPPGPSGPHGMRNFQNPPVPRMGGRPPIGIRPPIIGPPPPPPPNMAPGRFGPPRPLIPPPLAGCPPMGPPPLGGPMRPPQMRGGPIPPRAGPVRGNGPIGPAGPIRRNSNNSKMVNNRRNLRSANNKRKPGNGPAAITNNGTNSRPKKSTTTKKTLNEIINQYPLDKPWVTEEIREEHKKKEDIENRLKGNKNDKLFAEFKVQRDKFVKMYETARLEYIGKHPEQDIDKIMTEPSGKDKDEKANTKNANANEKNQSQSAAT